jgi:hypothetical protein
MAATRPRYISQDESELIRFQLAAKNRPRLVKAGLQRLCAHYERKCRFREEQQYRVTVRGLLWDETIPVRRWAYKAIKWVGDRHDKAAVVARLEKEQDVEIKLGAFLRL